MIDQKSLKVPYVPTEFKLLEIDKSLLNSFNKIIKMKKLGK